MLAGRVTVNGTVIHQLGFRADPSIDSIKVDGKKIVPFKPRVTLLLNKPRGYLSTVQDPEGRPTVMDLLKKVKGRIYPVGRLDFDAEGLLLFTNDGELAYHLSHPRFSIPRTYLVKVREVPEGRKLARLKKGMMLDDGMAKAISLRLLGKGEKNSWVEITVGEGRTHLVKKMFSAIGHPVIKLKRIRFGPIPLGDLPIGQFRYLHSKEMETLRKLTAP